MYLLYNFTYSKCRLVRIYLLAEQMIDMLLTSSVVEKLLAVLVQNNR